MLHVNPYLNLNSSSIQGCNGQQSFSIFLYQLRLFQCLSTQYGHSLGLLGRSGARCCWGVPFYASHFEESTSLPFLDDGNQEVLIRDQWGVRIQIPNPVLGGGMHFFHFKSKMSSWYQYQIRGWVSHFLPKYC